MRKLLAIRFNFSTKPKNAEAKISELFGKAAVVDKSEALISSIQS
jgi:hypothetical protein